MEQLEERIAHLIRANDDLSEVVSDQAKRIDTLERQVAFLMERARSDGEGSVFLGDERPPHW
ncbi:SlyX family protein [Palleronia abyssalis]|uniref:Protein SlyX n=1 Tax=Palleronia abyssalis TaxID=1501240 RepID=A0A2R8BYW4_9RHOB|nr:SlyX family protein [Palleronia abyssalis]SPJ25365.1 Protein SlyX [Palleronia abyssalis]